MLNEFSMENLAEEIKQIYVEMSFSSRWALIEMYHKIGELIASQPDADLKSLSSLSGVHIRNLERSLQFYKRFPSLDFLPDGKNTSWHKLVNKYLPEHSETPKSSPVKTIQCPHCGFVFPIDTTSK
jgi:hypothetical protein